MAYDAAGTQFEVKAMTDRARFAADLAKHANEPYGVRGSPTSCAPARFFGAMSFGAWQQWGYPFAKKFDALPRQPTGFDCLCILNSIP